MMWSLNHTAEALISRRENEAKMKKKTSQKLKEIGCILLVFAYILLIGFVAWLIV